jgi:hypothetical protein
MVTDGVWLLSSITSLRYYQGLLRAVKAGGEQSVLDFLKRFQRPLWVAFARGWNSIVLIPAFRCGNQYRSDFLLVNAMSGAIRATFIELEAPMLASTPEMEPRAKN